VQEAFKRHNKPTVVRRKNFALAGLFEKARLLKILLSNCTLKDGSPGPTYRKPFDLVAESVKTKEWLAFVDNLRTFCFEISMV